MLPMVINYELCSVSLYLKFLTHKSHVFQLSGGLIFLCLSKSKSLDPHSTYCGKSDPSPHFQGFPRTSVQFSRSVMSNSLWPHGLQHTRLSCPSPAPSACSNSCPSSRWCHLNISSSVVPFSACLQSFPASGSFPVSQFFTLGGQSTSPQNWVMVKGAPLCKFPHSKLHSYSRRILWNVNLIKLLKSRFEAVKRKTKSLWKPLNVHAHTHTQTLLLYVWRVDPPF